MASKCFNLILAEYPAAKEWETRAVKLLQQNGGHTPIIFLDRHNTARNRGGTH
jgi:hypothetical protein